MRKIFLYVFAGTLALAGCQRENAKLTDSTTAGKPMPTDQLITYIKLLQSPDRVAYVLDAPLDMAGLKVRITYSDGSFQEYERVPAEWIIGFSSAKPVLKQMITIQPQHVSSEIVKAGFIVDILPLRVEDKTITEVVSSEYREISIPEGIESIQKEAFGNCKIEKIVLPSTLKEMGEYTFYASKHLTAIDLSQTKITRLPKGCFESCSRLSDITFPQSLKTIEGNVFVGTSDLKMVKFPEGLEEIGIAAFSYSGIVEVELPNTVSSMNRSFYNCQQLESVKTYGNSIVSNVEKVKLEGECFQRCPKLQTLQIPTGIQKIGISILGECAVQEITLPSKINYLEYNSFGNATSVKTVRIMNDKMITNEGNPFSASVKNIMVRRWLLNKYQSGPSWAEYRNRFIEITP